MADRFFRALLKLLPVELRGDYGREMETTFRAARRDERGLGVARLWLTTAADIFFRTAPAEHWDRFALDARFALRSMRARPALTLAAVLTLALGIGANVAMFAVVDAVLLASLPYADPDGLVIVQEVAEARPPGNVGYLTFLDLRARTHVFSALAAGSQSRPILGGDGHDPAQVSAMRVSASYFGMVGAPPALGRTFAAAEDAPGAARRVVILSDGLWRRRFGADASIIGRPLSLSGTDFTVVGVMPPAFQDLVAARLFEGAELWTPLGYEPAADFACRTCRHLQVFGRLAPGVDVARAQREVTSVLQGLAVEHPRDYNQPSARVQTLGDLFLGPVRPVLLALWAGVAVLLLAACANVANLLLLRATERAHEIAVRTALGVTRGRLVRQLLTESALLAACGGAVGLLVAWAAVRVVTVAGPSQLPRLAQASLDPRAAVVAVALTALSALVFGLIPLRELMRQDVSQTMHGAGRRTENATTWRLRAALVASNVTLAAVLLVGAGLLVRSMLGLLTVQPGFDAAHVLTMGVQVSGPRYASDDAAKEIAAVSRFYADVLERVRTLPGVEAASATTTLPLSGEQDQFGLHLASHPRGNPEEAPDADRFAVEPGFFQVLRIPLLRGRLLEARDAQGATAVAVVNREAAEKLFPGEDPLGQQLRLGPVNAEPRTIVGVVGDTRHNGLDAPVSYQVYVPAAQWAWAQGSMTLVIRSSGNAAALATPVREIVRAVDASQPVTKVRLYEDVVTESTGTRRFACALLVAFAATALVLALVGLYGALAVLVRQRQREIGVRLALGAAASQIRRMILQQGLRPVAVGLLLGLTVAAASAQVLASLLFGITARDPGTFGAVTAVLAASALLACLVPAWRASRIDPAVTLRAE
jgi:putative ABC transport system permease protein